MDKTDLYKLDKFGLDVSNKEWRKNAFGSELDNIYDMKILNGMNYIHDNKVNHILDWNLLYNILTSSEHAKNINRNDSPILHICMSIHRVRANI